MPASQQFPVNPFATRYVRPGALPWIDVPDLSLTQLRDRIKQSSNPFAIVGPHGSGKSTLLAHLLQPMGEMEECFPPDRPSDAGNQLTFERDPYVDPIVTPEHRFKITSVVARRGNGFDKFLNSIVVKLHSNALLAIDGVEQVGLLQRTRLLIAIRMTQARLIATTHRPLLGFKTLSRTKPTPEILHCIVLRALEQQQLAIPPAFADRQNVAAIYDRYRGDLREALMHCHDLYRDMPICQTMERGDRKTINQPPVDGQSS